MAKGVLGHLHDAWSQVRHWLIMDPFNPFPNKPWFFTSLQQKSFENTVGKKEIARNNFSFPYSIFYPFGELSANFKLSAKSFSLKESKLKFVDWERVNWFHHTTDWIKMYCGPLISIRYKDSKMFWSMSACTYCATDMTQYFSQMH